MFNCKTKIFFIISIVFIFSLGLTGLDHAMGHPEGEDGEKPPQWTSAPRSPEDGMGLAALFNEINEEDERERLALSSSRPTAPSFSGSEVRDLLGRFSISGGFDEYIRHEIVVEILRSLNASPSLSFIYWPFATSHLPRSDGQEENELVRRESSPRRLTIVLPFPFSLLGSLALEETQPRLLRNSGSSVEESQPTYRQRFFSSVHNVTEFLERYPYVVPALLVMITIFFKFLNHVR